MTRGGGGGGGFCYLSCCSVYDKRDTDSEICAEDQTETLNVVHGDEDLLYSRHLTAFSYLIS